MGKTKQDMMGKVYREFSRQKYNKYKHQFPKMRESEIVSKIIRQWDCLDHQAKEELQMRYEHHHALSPVSHSPSDSQLQTETKKRQLQTTQRKQEKGTPLRTPAQSEIKFEQVISEFRPSEAAQSKSIGAIKYFDESAVENARKTSSKQNAYLNFFRFYYQKYSRDHPNWAANKITSIIQLLWRKRKEQNKKITVAYSTKKPIFKIPKGFSGRKLFRKIKKDLNGAQCKKIWNRLPMETKKMWNRSAKGQKKEEPREFKILLKGCEDESEINSGRLNFMGKLIQK